MAERGPETLRFGPMKPVGLTDPRTGRRPVRGRPAAPGQRARHALQHGRLPDQADLRRADADLPHDPGPRAGRVRAPRRPAPQHLHQQPAPARSGAPPQGPARTSASPVRSPASRATSRALRSACSRAASRPPRSGARPWRRRPPTTALGALLDHITGGAAAATFQPMNVNFGLLPAARAPAQTGRAQARARAARARRPRRLARPARRRGLKRGASPPPAGGPGISARSGSCAFRCRAGAPARTRTASRSGSSETACCAAGRSDRGRTASRRRRACR